MTIEPGFFTLELLCRAGNVGDRDKPVLTIEIVAGTLVIGSRDLLAGALEQSVWIAFEIAEAVHNRDAKMEFRFSHHGNADIEIAAARLHMANGAHRGSDDNLGRRPRRSFLGIPLAFSRRTARNGGEIVGGPAL
jgi:hypothetical protein